MYAFSQSSFLFSSKAMVLVGGGGRVGRIKATIKTHTILLDNLYIRIHPSLQTPSNTTCTETLQTNRSVTLARVCKPSPHRLRRDKGLLETLYCKGHEGKPLNIGTDSFTHSLHWNFSITILHAAEY